MQKPSIYAIFNDGSATILSYTDPQERIKAAAQAMNNWPKVVAIDFCDVEHPGFRLPNHMDVQTGHRTFDRKADYVATGNVISNVQMSFYLRARSQTSCNNQEFQPGQLQEWDLSTWLKQSGTNRTAKHKLANWLARQPLFEKSNGWVYLFRHYNTDQSEMLHGAVVTDSMHRKVAVFQRQDLLLERSAKSEMVVNTLKRYVSIEESIPRQRIAVKENEVIKILDPAFDQYLKSIN